MMRFLLLAFALATVASAQLSDGLYAAFDTTMGGFTCRLDYAEAPLACANFVGLAEGTQSWISTNGAVKAEPYYDGLIIHRVIDGFMIQGGCPLGNGTSGPGYTFPDQISTTLSHARAGILSMANSGPDSNGSQFFITLDSTPWLDGKHAVFGEVVEGMNIVSNIGSVATDAGNRPLTNVVMNAIQILRVGSEAQAFNPGDEPLPEVMPVPVAFSNMVLSVSTSNQCEQVFYSSTNLLNWAIDSKKYSPVAGDDWSEAIIPDNSVEYFKGFRVFCPQAVTNFSNIEGHTLSFTNELYTLVYRPISGGVGSCEINENADSLVFWQEFTSEPYNGRVLFESSAGITLQFTLAPDRACSGYQLNGFSWSYVGDFVFSNSAPLSL